MKCSFFLWEDGKKESHRSPFAVLKAGCMDQKNLCRPVSSSACPTLSSSPDTFISEATWQNNHGHYSDPKWLQDGTITRLNPLMSANKVSWKPIKTNFHQIRFEYSQSRCPVGPPTFDLLGARFFFFFFFLQSQIPKLFWTTVFSSWCNFTKDLKEINQKVLSHLDNLNK